MDKLPPKLTLCKGCSYNIGNVATNLCASCDPNHRWWKKEDELVEKFKKLKF